MAKGKLFSQCELREIMGYVTEHAERFGVAAKAISDCRMEPIDNPLEIVASLQNIISASAMLSNRLLMLDSMQKQKAELERLKDQ